MRPILLLVPALVLTACTAPAERDPGLKVGGAFGAEPSVAFPSGRPPDGLRIDQLSAGKGAKLGVGDVAIVHYTAHVWDGAENRRVDSSFARGAPAAFPVGRLVPGLDKALAGRAVGSRVIAAIPPAEGFGANPPQGVGPADRLLYVMDVLGAHAEGESVKGRAGAYAGVRVGGGRRPELSLPAAPPPARYSAKVLVRGDGPRVERGQLVVTQYAGAVWGRRRVFDSTWDSGRPRAFTIGDGGVIQAWERALMGVPVGSRVLVLAPPHSAYGRAGLPALGIRPSDTLVFVVDVLAAYR
ncbi:FKBP-type peptidyl-prolyl cis-trans isomerase [Nonomuraea sp. NPDC050790]|uniref:FKBP-type peptidyl-prolyl cis-trans isomerase n=1 Tax=Nonomuraea sp. NPDC050790 TaxID=3364371 RepID=UPI0037BCDB96